MAKCNEKKRCASVDREGNCTVLKVTVFNGKCPFFRPCKGVPETVIEDQGRRWKPIKGYETRYWVSDMGEVKNASGRLLSQITDKNGKKYVGLYTGGKRKAIALTVLVADAFLPGNGFVYHKNGDKTDNRAENLGRR